MATANISFPKWLILAKIEAKFYTPQKPTISTFFLSLVN